MDDAVTLSLFIYGLAAVIAAGAALLIKIIVGALSFSDARAAAAAKPAPVAAPVPQPAAGLIPEHHLVAITAAAYAMVGAHRIVHIGHVSNGPVWSAEGRLAQHSSHRPSTHH